MHQFWCTTRYDPVASAAVVFSSLVLAPLDVYGLCTLRLNTVLSLWLWCD
ncbi:hypothetical protein AAHH86_00170 [Candidatus Hodgkinia cicadicola]